MSATRRVLVIDDDAAIRDVVQLGLQVVAGWEVLTADSGSAGLATARSAQPDAILLDMMMPELDGPQTLNLLQADDSTRDIPVIFLTALVPLRRQEGFDRPGVRAVIAKPFNPLDLAGRVAEALHWS